MHELAIAQGIIRAVDESIPAARVASIKRIWVTVGELSAVQKECLEFAFEAVTSGTRLEGAGLVLEYVKPLFRCQKCAREFEPSDGFFSPCPGCGGFGVDVVKGNELYVKSVELDEDDE